ncbi:MAG TPA: YtxH domain-containing protein [Candidatus Dormibacteraeota bacterium]|nr:YtxH domain-containing protein [Candidatus Dormibacteraeota bacterium]
MKDYKSGTILAFVVGIGIGAVAALLLAPKAGGELRDDISGAVGDRVDQLRDQGKDLTRRSKKFVETANERLQGALDQGADAFKQAKKAGA